MWTKRILLTCVLSLGSFGISQAHPLDSPDIVYIDGMPCNSACQSYMAWSRQTLSLSGHHAPTQLRQRSANVASHGATTAGKKLKPASQAAVSRPIVPLPRAKVATLQPADDAAVHSEMPPDNASADTNSGTTGTIQGHVAVAHAEQQPAATMAPVPEQAGPSTNAGALSALPPTNSAAGPGTRTMQDQVTAVTTADEPATVAAGITAAPERKADVAERSARPEAIQPGAQDMAASARPYNVARLEPPAAANSNIKTTRTIQEQVTAATVIAEYVVTLRDAEKAASGSPSNPDLMVVLVIARPEINSISDLTGKEIAMDDRHSASGDKVRSAIAASGATEVRLSQGQPRAIDRLIGGEVPAAVLTLAYPETGFPQFAGFNIFRIPLAPRSLNARL